MLKKRAKFEEELTKIESPQIKEQVVIEEDEEEDNDKDDKIDKDEKDEKDDKEL